MGIKALISPLALNLNCCVLSFAQGLKINMQQLYFIRTEQKWYKNEKKSSLGGKDICSKAAVLLIDSD